MAQEQFIKEIARLVQKYAPQYGIKVHSPIIAQAILESKSGTSNKVYYNGEWRHNYFGLKWRNNRCLISNDYFEEWTSEQNPDGSYKNIVSKFCRFKGMEEGVIGYFQWTNISTYANLKGVTDPETYLKNIKADKYATSKDYVENLMSVIRKYNLTQYDPQPEQKYYRVQAGAFKSETNAKNLQSKLKAAGFSVIIKQIDGLYKCQMGAFRNKSNAEDLLQSVKSKGFDAFLIYQ